MAESPPAVLEVRGLTKRFPGVLANDNSNGGGVMTAGVVANVSHGVLALATNGSFTYTPNAGFSGNDTFTYRATNSSGPSNIATVTINIGQSGLPPVWSYAGGTFRSELLRDLVAARVGSQPVEPRLPPIGGSLVAAAQTLGWDIDDDWIARRLRRQPTHLPGMLRRAEVVERYVDAMGSSPADWVFYEVYGLFRVAVIAQQIYYRYHHRQTRNPAFRSFWILVRYFHWRCTRLMEQARS